MDSRTKVLLYLERNNNIEVSSTGKIVLQRKISMPNSRESSIGSAGSSKQSRSSSPARIPSKNYHVDDFSKNLNLLISDLAYTKEKRTNSYNKYFKEEAKLANFLEQTLKKEKIKAKPDTNFPDNPFIVQKAELIAKKERECEKYIKENKALKTLLAEMTLFQVDTKLNISKKIKRDKVDMYTAASVIEKYSRNIMEYENNITFDLANKQYDFSINYNKAIDEITNEFISSEEYNFNDMIIIICKSLVIEQESRLSSEEAVDISIASKEKIIIQLEQKIQKLNQQKFIQNKKIQNNII